MPADLLVRVKQEMVRRGMTFRALVIDALEQALRRPRDPFRLRDASAGAGGGGEADQTVTSRQINRAIDDQREPSEGQ